MKTAAREVVLICYTTQYREGGREMQRAARQLADRKRQEFPDADMRCCPTETKAAFQQTLMQAAEEDGAGPIRELHFIGHSGLYGPMFGTRRYPEQMSRHEWRQFAIPFAPDAQAFFHCCRSARWFAPFFSRTYGVVAHGCPSYTTFSRQPDRYAPIDAARDDAPIYVVAVPGYKAAGWRGAIRKRWFHAPTLPMTRFDPQPEAESGSYDSLADLYDAVFEDFRVRQDEWRWLTQQMDDRSEPPALLDIGCGNGALLTALAPLLRHGVGVDASARMIDLAQRRAMGESNLEMRRIDGPRLPLPDASVDVVVSMLSWRYLDWDPMAREIQRVLRPGGSLLIVDMVVAPFQMRVAPRVLRDKIKVAWQGMAKPDFRRALRRLVEDPRWSVMLQHNPMRAEHEMRWYLPSRFVGGQFATLNRGPRIEILAFRWDKPADEAAPTAPNVEDASRPAAPV